jgi:hypothetical protein
MTDATNPFADLTRRGQQLFASAVQAWEQVGRSHAEARRPGGPPDVGASLEAAFDFAAQMLAEQREFAKALMSVNSQALSTAAQGARPGSETDAAASDERPARGFEPEPGTVVIEPASEDGAAAPSTTDARKAAPRKAAPRKAAAREAAARKAAAREAAVRKVAATPSAADTSTPTGTAAAAAPAAAAGPARTTAKKTPAKRTAKASAATTPATGRAPAKKAPAKTAATKTAAQKASPTKVAAAKKAAASSPAPPAMQGEGSAP